MTVEPMPYKEIDSASIAWGVAFTTITEADALHASEAYLRDLIFQDMNRNYWSLNPGELERWADDGGYVAD